MKKINSNLIKYFIVNECRSFFRGTDLVQKTTINIFSFTFNILVFYTCYIIGLELNFFINKIYPSYLYLNSLYIILIIYSFVDIFLRHLFQKIPIIDLNKYLMLNIKKKIIKRYFVLRTFFTLYSIIPLLIFIPFIYNNIFSEYGIFVGIKIIILIFLISIGNHFIIIYLKKKSLINEKMFLIPFLFFITIWLLNREHVIQFSSINILIKRSDIVLNTLIFIYLSWFLFALFIFFKELKNNFYFESKTDPGLNGKLINENLLIGKKNIIFKLVVTELKLFLRNKRPRSILYSFIFSLVYAYIMFRSEINENSNIIFIEITCIIVSGIVVNNYAQYLLAWQSDYFEFMFISNIKLKEMIWSKFYVCDIINILSFIILSPFIIRYSTLIPILISAQLYNIGIQPILALFFACFNSKYLNINKVDNFNYQGLGIEQLLYVLSNVILAAMIYFPFSLISNSWIGVIIVGLIGLINIIFRKFWVTILERFLKKNKYKILNGFRLK